LVIASLRSDPAGDWRKMSGLRADECLAFAITFRHQPDCVALIARKASLALFVLALQEPLFTSQ